MPRTRGPSDSRLIVSRLVHSSTFALSSFLLYRRKAPAGPRNRNTGIPSPDITSRNHRANSHGTASGILGLPPLRNQSLLLGEEMNEYQRQSQNTDRVPRGQEGVWRPSCRYIQVLCQISSPPEAGLEAGLEAQFPAPPPEVQFLIRGGGPQGPSEIPGGIPQGLLVIPPSRIQRPLENTSDFQKRQLQLPSHQLQTRSSNPQPNEVVPPSTIINSDYRQSLPSPPQEVAAGARSRRTRSRRTHPSNAHPRQPQSLEQRGSAGPAARAPQESCLVERCPKYGIPQQPCRLRS